MNITYFRHLSDSRYCFSIDESHVLLRLAVSKLFPIDKVEVIFGDPITYSNKHYYQQMHIKYEDQAFYYYETVINVYPMRLMYIFKITKNKKDYFLCETDIYDGFDFSLSFLSAYQFVGENRNDYILEKPSWKGRVVYQIFPERFAYRENYLDKSYVNADWNIPHIERGQNYFLGGDLYGVIDKLDYLEDLGISAIYLTPIHPSPTNHKYDVIDYFDIEPRFGGKEAFKELVEKAHNKNMKVMMDLVFNHCSNFNPIFLDVKEKGRSSKYYNWFFINGDKPTEWPLNYLCFAYARNMPKLNTNNPEVQEYLISVAKYYVNEYHVDGYRLDVSEGVSHDFWNKFKLALKQLDPDFLVIGENWLNSESYLSSNQFDGVMNYPFLSAVSGYLLGKRDAKRTSLHLQQLLMRYKDGHNRMMLNILGSHDIQRMMNLVNDPSLSLIGYAIMMFYLGYPMIYYGEEIFMSGGPDPDNRRGMKWNSEYFDSEEHRLFKALIHLRKLSPLAEGEISITADGELLNIYRYTNDEEYRLVTNLGKVSRLIDGEAILSNNYLHKNGFVVIKVK